MNDSLTTGVPHRPADTPFGPARAGVGRWLRFGLFGVLLAAAAAAAYLLTRKRETPMPAGHTHGAAAAADSAREVTLSAENARKIGVVFAQATLAPLARRVRTVGLVTYDETRVQSVSPLIDGQVERLFVNFTGQAVRRGDPLLSIYSPMVVATAQELVLAKRLRDEVTVGGTPDAVRGAEDLLASARRRLLYWNVPPSEVERLERTGEIRKTVTLQSPVAGVVVEKTVLAGQRIMAGEPLYKVADLGTVWLEGQVFEQDLPAVRLGQEVSAEFQALPGETRAGRITYIYPTLDPETRTARVRVALANSDLRLKPGMYATFHFDAPTAPVTSVPRSAVLSTGTRDLVFVRRVGGALAPREVVLGVATDERVQVLNGIEPGDTVVASATFLVDAESNLGSALGGMADMPGMDVQQESRPNGPVKPRGTPRTVQSPAARKE